MSREPPKEMHFPGEWVPTSLELPAVGKTVITWNGSWVRDCRHERGAFYDARTHQRCKQQPTYWFNIANLNCWR